MANCAKEEAALRALQNQIKIATQGSRTNVAQLRRDIVAAKMALQKCKNASGAMLDANLFGHGGKTKSKSKSKKSNNERPQYD